MPEFHAYLLVARLDVVEREPAAVAALVAGAARGYRLAAADPEVMIREYEQITPYFGADLLARSLRLLAPTWTHAGKWGPPRRELLGPYAERLVRWGLLTDPDVWRGACTTGFLPTRPRQGVGQR